MLCHRLVEETERHIWFECPYVKEVADIVWRKMGVGFRGATIHNWMDWFGRDDRQGSVIFKCKLLALCSLVYFTWRARNLHLYEGIKWTPSECANVILRECKARINAKCKFTSRVDKQWRDFVGLGIV